MERLLEREANNSCCGFYGIFGGEIALVHPLWFSVLCFVSLSHFLPRRIQLWVLRTDSAVNRYGNDKVHGTGLVCGNVLDCGRRGREQR
jgi:hypothetical protein